MAEPARLIGVLALVAAALVGCTSEAPAPEESPTTAVSPTVAPTATAPADCAAGEYRVVRMTALSGQPAAGEGGDLTGSFADGAFSLVGRGADPVRLRAGERQAEVTVEGTIAGSYAVAGAEGTYQVTSTEGSARLRFGVLRYTASMDQVADLLAPQRNGTVICAGERLTLTSAGARVELQRQ